jgi:hypothetical protein
MIIWSLSLVALAVFAVAALRWLNRQRGLFLGDPQRRRFFVHYMQRMAHALTQERPVIPRFPPVSVPLHQLKAPAGHEVPGAQGRRNGDQGVAYVDAEGRCTFANETARDLLHWYKGELALSDVLAGGPEECAALLAALAQQGTVEPHPTSLSGPRAMPVELSAVALRDRDDNFWGAAFFIRRVGATTDPLGEPFQH